MTDAQLKSLCRLLEHEGPDRVVINPHGEAIPPSAAKKAHDVVSDVIYIRDDAWSLGAPKSLDSVAHSLWAGDWIAKMEKTGDGKWQLQRM